MKQFEGYFTTDEGLLFFNAIAFAQDQVRACLSETLSVPWAIIATHMMVQTACVFALNERDGTQTACLADWFGKENVRQKTVDAIHASPPEAASKERLADPALLLRRTQDSSDVMGAEALSLGEDTKRDLARLLEFRNMIVHFLPQSWSLELIGMPRIFRSAFKFALMPIERLGTYSHSYDKQKRDEAAEVCRAMIFVLEQPPQFARIL